ncbi:5'-nucleotidase C-terminal domain-containing protein [Robiginitalea sp. SC105]|nr:5'-nucleotidase C-terminal domain-containing protein [Robiginitalea sp. SC105]
MASCRQGPVHLSGIRASQTVIDSSLSVDDSLDLFIAPYRDHLEAELNAPLAYAPETLRKNDGTLTSSLGNLLADLVLEQTDSLRVLQGNPPVDAVVLNAGGIRNIISRGPVSQRTAYEVMPFENTIFIVPMQGAPVRELISFLTANRKPHPIAGLEIVLAPDGSLASVNIGGQPFDEERTYYIATSNYLYEGGDDMAFFRHGGTPEDTRYKIRNAMVDYFRRIDTLRSSADDRFFQMPER